MKQLPCCKNALINKFKPIGFNKIILVFYCWFALLTVISLQAKTIQITTWNTEWLLSKSDFAHYKTPTDVQLRNPKDITRLAYYARQLNSDLFALQEVGSIETAQQIIPKDQYRFFTTQDEIPQHPVLAIRKTLPFHMIQNPDLVTLSHAGKTHPLRSGLDLTLYNDHVNIRILVVHLKAQCQDKPLTSSLKACTSLKQQQLALQHWITARVQEHQPFIILGDFNRILSLHDDFFKELSKITPLTIPTTQLASPCWGGNYFFDGFVLDTTLNQSIIPNSLKVLVYQEKNYMLQSNLSDHCPVSIKLDLK